uniref:Uncharacterized protein n=1 Tax=Anguilla anguilla TaxID=7936 RepID=A0A0E9QM14_ANGAN
MREYWVLNPKSTILPQMYIHRVRKDITSIHGNTGIDA